MKNVTNHKRRENHS